MSVTIDCGEGRHGLCVGHGESPYLIPQLAGDTFTCACSCHKSGRREHTPTEQTIVDLDTFLARNGPTPREEIVRRGIAVNAEIDLRLNSGLLLRCERTVECRDCVFESFPPCRSCKGTGSVRERVIGRPCRRCKGVTTVSGCPEPRWDAPGRYRCSLGGQGTVCSIHGKFIREPCHRCASTPTPGLNPGDMPYISEGNRTTENSAITEQSTPQRVQTSEGDRYPQWRIDLFKAGMEERRQSTLPQDGLKEE